MKKRKLLFINAHPDDDCTVTGTMITLIKKGWAVKEYVCTDGARAQTFDTNKGIVKNRQEEIERFSKEIGAETPSVFPLGDRLLSVSDEVVFDLVAQIREFRPDVIILLGHNDYHFEHRLSHKIGILATENASRKTLPNLGERVTDFIILEGEGLNLMHNPLITFDISNVFKKKTKVIEKVYGKRLGNDVTRFIEGVSQARGARIGISHGEAFNLLNPEWYKFTSKAAEVLSEFLTIGSRNSP